MSKKGLEAGRNAQISLAPQVPNAPQVPQIPQLPQVPQASQNPQVLQNPQGLQQNQPQVAQLVLVPMAFAIQYLFPFPGQEGAPFFEGNNITRFINTWEDLTIGWPKDNKVKRIPLYCKEAMGNTIKALASYRAI